MEYLDLRQFKSISESFGQILGSVIALFDVNSSDSILTTQEKI